MSRESKSPGSCVTAAAIPPIASIATRSRWTDIANWRSPSWAITHERKEHPMDVGMMMVFASYGWENCSDARVWEEEIRLARLAADLGFDCLWSAEHHFNDYSFVPDNLQLMTYLTAACPNIDLGTAAVIIPRS